MIRFLKARLGGESGLAMPVVIGITSVMAILVTAGIAVSLGGLRQAQNTENWSGALAAAYAGVEEYQSRLANDTTYMRYGNPAAPFSAASGSTEQVVLPTGGEANPAFGIGADGAWADVPGSEDAQFRYEVDNAAYVDTGVIRLRSTGRVGEETRSILADLRQDGFIDFLYFTDYEIQDPVLSGLNESQRAGCVKYAYQGRPSSFGGRSCGNIAFGEYDTLNGPTHSNDTIRACSATFNGLVTTADPAGALTKKNSLGNNCSSSDMGGVPNSPRTAIDLEMPPTNTSLAREVRADLAGNGVPRPGCLYTGPTQITLNSDGTMTVFSPWTKATQVIGDPATSAHLNSLCGTPGNSGLGKVGGQKITVPDNNIAYVQNVPTTVGNPNTWASGFPTNVNQCREWVSTSWWGSGYYRDTNGIGYPLLNEEAPYANGAAQESYGCRNGDLFVKGTLDGHLTLSAENYIYVTGDIKYRDKEDDVLGLISNNIVWVWNPVTSSGGRMLSDYNRRIDAAILSVQRTFTVQNNDKGGDRGTLTVNGAIAQVYRGIVRSGNNGYAKEYNYDSRFKTIAPPRFLSPVTTTYGVTTWIEVDRAYNSDGSAR